jgi:isopentenyl phosphate kinase
MTIFVKFGGSVITDKRRPETPDLAAIAALSGAVATACAARPELRLVLSHGSGSYGHVAAARYGVHTGLADGADWYGYAATAGAALRLNRIVVDALLAAQVPAVSYQPSATCETDRGAVVAWETDHIVRALAHRLVPVIHGDVSFDRSQGSAIASTEMLLQWLCRVPALTPHKIILVGESAVYTADPHRDPSAQRIPVINAANIGAVLGGASGSHGVDVTGGMASKIRLMWSLIEQTPGLEVQFIRPDAAVLHAVLTGTPITEGTLMQA